MNDTQKTAEMVQLIRAAAPFISDGYSLHRIETVKLKNTMRHRLYFRKDLDNAKGERSSVFDSELNQDSL